MKKINLITSQCKRCKKPVTTLDRSLTGSDKLKAELGEICESCITPEEEYKILQGQGNALMESIAKNY